MANKVLLEKAASLDAFRGHKPDSQRRLFRPTELAHVYLKLDLDNRYENARTADDARLFLRSVSRAATAASAVARRFGGEVLEVQGSLIHIGLSELDSPKDSTPLNFVSTLHVVLKSLFARQERVSSWRMTFDAGKTLVVKGNIAHGDDSLVSLGPAANRPAKYLYAQLERAEADRQLKRFHVGFRNPKTTSWEHVDLDGVQVMKSWTASSSATRQQDPVLQFIDQAADRALVEEPSIRYIDALGPDATVLAMATPLGTPGTPSSPTADRPRTYFGWVMRSDLDGFSARVEMCLDDDALLQELAKDFYLIMDESREFVAKHDEELAQLPWAGDNFTASAVFDTLDDYNDAIPDRLVELVLDFEKELNESALISGFGGWAHGIAGGSPHGNSGGNVYLAGIEINGHRFLVGAGEGFGRSTQAFGDINPNKDEVVIYHEDWKELAEPYKDLFKPASKTRGEVSSLFRVASAPDLAKAKTRLIAKGTSTTVTTRGSRQATVETRPWSE